MSTTTALSVYERGLSERASASTFAASTFAAKASPRAGAGGWFTLADLLPVVQCAYSTANCTAGLLRDEARELARLREPGHAHALQMAAMRMKFADRSLAHAHSNLSLAVKDLRAEAPSTTAGYMGGPSRTSQAAALRRAALGSEHAILALMEKVKEDGSACGPSTHWFVTRSVTSLLSYLEAAYRNLGVVVAATYDAGGLAQRGQATASELRGASLAAGVAYRRINDLQEF